jgi:hypothetical protein
MRIAIVAIAILVAASCASAPPYWYGGDVTLVEGTVHWARFGTNYSIAGLTQNSTGERVEVTTYANDCEDGYGKLWEEPWVYHPVDREQVVLRGPSARDRIFSELCQRTMNEILTYESRLTPHQKQQRLEDAIRVMQAVDSANSRSTRIEQPRRPTETVTECKSIAASPTNERRCTTKQE